VLAIGGQGTNFMTYRRLTDLGDPAGIFVILDERHDSINEGNFVQRQLFFPAGDDQNSPPGVRGYGALGGGAEEGEP